MSNRKRNCFDHFTAKHNVLTAVLATVVIITSLAIFGFVLEKCEPAYTAHFSSKTGDVVAIFDGNGKSVDVDLEKVRYEKIWVP